MKLLLFPLIRDNDINNSSQSSYKYHELFSKLSEIVSNEYENIPDSNTLVIKSINDDYYFICDDSIDDKIIDIYPWNFDILSKRLDCLHLLFDILSYHRILYSLHDSSTSCDIMPIQLMIYSDIVTSTQTILENNWVFTQHLPHGTIFLTSHQTKGKGRSGNKWQSAPGCLQFTMVWDVHIKCSVLLYQYYATLSIVEAILSIPGYEKLPLQVKWPNDIYCVIEQNDRCVNSRKLGGVIVQANHINDKFTKLLIGLGLNIDNSDPTYCLNELISNFKLPTTTREIVLARFSTMFPILVQKWSLDFEKFQTDYKRRWIHYKDIVYLQESKRSVELIGLDHDGYLLVRDCNSNEEISIQPGSHSFDVEQCVITQKIH